MGKGLSGISKAIKVFSENAIYTEAKVKTPRYHSHMLLIM